MRPATETPFLPATDTATPLPSATPTATQTATATLTPAPTATSEPTPTPTPEPVILMGAGDIAACGVEGDEQTAALLERFPQAAIFTSGDNVYDKGAPVEYRNCYGPSWGRFLDRTHPVPGNHDYNTNDGIPYYDYFGSQAGEHGKGFYSYDLGEWHIVALNTNCEYVSCALDSEQANWLRADLEASTKRCTLAYWHHPRWSSGLAGNSGKTSVLWRILYEHGAEIVVNGHDHNYERFAPQDAEGNAVPNGIRAFVVGTGGSYQRAFGETQPNSEVRQTNTLGVIRFTLYVDRYEWEFMPVDGQTFTDTGSGNCH